MQPLLRGQILIQYSKVFLDKAEAGEHLLQNTVPVGLTEPHEEQELFNSYAKLCVLCEPLLRSKKTSRKGMRRQSPRVLAGKFQVAEARLRLPGHSGE